MTHIGPSGNARQIYFDAINARPMNRHLVASFRNLQRHKETGAFDHYAALRLLRNNVRDISKPPVSERDKRAIAELLLQFWRLHWLADSARDDAAMTQSE